jgi:hypothetical protein
MQTLKEIILKADGSCVVRKVDETEVSVAELIIAEFTRDAVLVVHNAFTVEGLKVGLIKGPGGVYAFCWLKSLTLTCPWVSSGGVMTPAFTDETGQNPVIPMEWFAPSDMALMFSAKLFELNTITRPNDACQLIAFSNGDQRGFQLPLPNLYDNCNLCMGVFNGEGQDAQSAFTLALKQFRTSHWNADLFNSDKRNFSGKMFRFKPVADKFEQVHVADWSNYSFRCENATVNLLRNAML